MANVLLFQVEEVPVPEVAEETPEDDEDPDEEVEKRRTRSGQCEWVHGLSTFD